MWGVELVVMLCLRSAIQHATTLHANRSCDDLLDIGQDVCDEQGGNMKLAQGPFQVVDNAFLELAMLGVQQMLSGGKQPAQAKVLILVAKTDIDPGVPLEKTNVGFKEWPKDALPEGAITKEAEYAERALKHRVGPGQRPGARVGQCRAADARRRQSDRRQRGADRQFARRDGH